MAIRRAATSSARIASSSGFWKPRLTPGTILCEVTFLVPGSVVLLLAWVSPLAEGKDCGRLPTGTNPGMDELDQEIAKLSAKFRIPTEVIKGIAWQESGCQQWRADGTLVYNKTDCGLGMMQLTGATAAQFDVERLKDDWRYNLEAGFTVLNQKWARAQRSGQVPADPAARRVLENWYYAIAYYWGGREESYLRKIFGHIENRPGRLQTLLRRGVKVTIASDVIEGFSFGDAFLAREGDRIEDKGGEAIQAPTHLGTIGDADTMAALDVWLGRGKQALEKGKLKQAIRYLLKVSGVEHDTGHKGEALALLGSLEAAARQQVVDARAKHDAGASADALKLLRQVTRDYKGLPVSDEAKALVAEIQKATKG